MPTTKLRVERCEFAYEGLFSQPVFSLTDTPGKLADLLLDILSPFGCLGSDLEFDEDEFTSRGVTCEISELDATISLYGDRAEFHSPDSALDSHQDVAKLLKDLWLALAVLDPRTVPKTISFRFDVDSQVVGSTYQELMNRLAPLPASLPSGTESAIVYYLPPDPQQGFRHSSLVLNRSEAVERGLLQVSATLVYEGQTTQPQVTLEAAKRRLDDLIQKLGLEWGQ